MTWRFFGLWSWKDGIDREDHNVNWWPLMCNTSIRYLSGVFECVWRENRSYWLASEVHGGARAEEGRTRGQGEGRLLFCIWRGTTESCDLELHASAVDPWTTVVWIALVCLYVNWFSVNTVCPPYPQVSYLRIHHGSKTFFSSMVENCRCVGLAVWVVLWHLI